MYYTLVPYKVYSISYISVLLIFLLFFTLSLLSIYEKRYIKFYVIAGFCYGVCCVNNPLLCILFAIYLILCVLWLKKDILINLLSDFYIIKKISKSNTKKSTLKSFDATKKKTLEKKRRLSQSFENYNCFFRKEAIMYSTIGISIIAVISIIFFFITGGTISSIFENFENLIYSSEYLGSSNQNLFTQQILELKKAIDLISFNMPYLLPIVLLIILADKKRTINSHRVIYLITAVLLSVLFIAGMSVHTFHITNIRSYFFHYRLLFLQLFAIF